MDSTGTSEQIKKKNEHENFFQKRFVNVIHISGIHVKMHQAI